MSIERSPSRGTCGISQGFGVFGVGGGVVLEELLFFTMAKPQKKKNVKRKNAAEIELHPDAWERFEKGLKQIVQPKRAEEEIWGVDFAKRGGGFTVHPKSGQQPGDFPIFRTQLEARRWMKAHGYSMVGDDEDLWTKPT
jgi:hypothetical protein